MIRRVEKKQLRMTSPFELSYGIVSAMIRREADLIADLAKESGLLEQRVMLDDDLEDPEAFLRSCSRPGMCSSRFEPLPCTAAQVMDGWHGSSASYLMRPHHCSPISQINSTSSRPWLTGSGSSCTASLSSTRPDLDTFDHCCREISSGRSPTKPRHAPYHRMGRNRCRADGSDRILRSERALSRRRVAVGLHSINTDDHHLRLGSLPCLQTQRMAVTTPQNMCPAGKHKSAGASGPPTCKQRPRAAATHSAADDQ